MRKIIQPCGFHCIKINNLGVSFGEQTVLEDVNMHIHCGSFNVIIGQNGAGKSTLIKAILYDLIASYQYNYPVFLPKSKKIEAKIRETLGVFEAEELIDKQVCNLSGGQLQRVLLSMAIMDEPNLLLLDEPVSGIDQNGMELFYKTMDYLKTHYDLAIILISHDLDYVARYADHVVLLDKTVAKQGTVKEVFESKEFERIFYTGEESWVREEEHK